MEDVNERRRILFPSLKLSALLKKSTPGKFAYICHFQQIGINLTVFGKREFILKVTFSLPLPSSMLKLSSFSIEDGDDSENVTFKMNSRFFKLCCVYSNSLKISNVGEFPWS